jgi:hypothetical protein
MSDNVQSAPGVTLNPVVLSCYAVAICSFITAGIGLGITHFPSVGLAIVGVFYLIVAVVGRVSSRRAQGRNAVPQISLQTSGADNLVAEAIILAREPSATAHTGRLAGAQR